MPVMDGLEATARIRAWEATQGASRLPIVALSAGAFAEDGERCRAAGMDAFLIKPVRHDDLAAIVARFLPDKGQGGTPLEDH
jgi:CheY-like chemotaxis protein